MSFLEFVYPEDLTLVGAQRNKKMERIHLPSDLVAKALERLVIKAY